MGDGASVLGVGVGVGAADVAGASDVAGGVETEGVELVDGVAPGSSPLLSSCHASSPSATPSRRGSAPPSNPSGVMAMMASPLVKGKR